MRCRPTPAATVELGSYWRQAEDIECLRRRLGLERVLLVGYSAGTRWRSATPPSSRAGSPVWCGHYPWVEQPAAFRQAVDGFIDLL